MFNFGLIGPSGFGQFLIRTLQGLPEVRVAAIAARREETLKQLADRYGVPKYYTHYHDMLADPEINAVFVVTPPYLHHPMARDALLAEKHVIVEKPAALKVQEVRGLASLAKKKHLQIVVDYEMRYSPIYEVLDRVAKSKLLGSVKLIEFTNLAGGYNLPDWFWDAERSGGIFIEHGIHFFDIFQRIFGNAKHLYSKIYKGDHSMPRRAYAVVEFPGSVFGTFHHQFDRIDPLARTYSKIVFERGVLELEGWIPLQLSGLALLEQERISKLRTMIPDDSIRIAHSYGGDPFKKQAAARQPMLVEIHHQSPYDKEVMFQKMIQDLVEEFIDSISSNRLSKTSLETTVESLEIASECTRMANK